ncbi:MAG: hypothetical protein ABH854_05795 [Candidatus Diapherotrites archaeon]
MDAPTFSDLNPTIEHIERLSGAAVVRMILDGQHYTGTLGKVRI